MEFTFRAALEKERLYFFTQSPQIMSICGSVGRLRIEDGASRPVWSDYRSYLKNETVKSEIAGLASLLTESEKYFCALSGRENMMELAGSDGSAAFPDGKNYGYRFDSGRYAYLLRIENSEEGTNSLIYPYRKDWLDGHIEKAAEGIRFIDTEYTELFRIKDGGRVRFFYPDGAARDETVRYIDRYHIEYPDSPGSLLPLHICEDAERRQKKGIKVFPLDSPLRSADKDRPGECLPPEGDAR